MAKQSHDRREFLGLAIGVAGGAAGGTWALTGKSFSAGADQAKADLVVTNANVYTVDSQIPSAQAFAVKNGRFLAVGSSDDIRSLIGKGTERYDAKGMTIVPGFVDCHNHAQDAGTVLRYETILGNPY